LIGAGFICWRLLLISLVVAPVVGFLLFWITRKLKQTSHDVLKRSSHFHEVMLESLGNVQTVQSYGMEDRETDRFAASTSAMRKNGMLFIFYTALTKPVIEFLGLGMLCTTIVAGSYLVLNHQTQLFGVTISDTPLTVTSMLIFFSLLVGASDPLRKLSMVYSSIYTGAVAANSLYPLLDQPNHIRDPELPVTVPSPHKMLHVDKVWFAYRVDHNILTDVSLDIPYGSTIAIVGQNGTGKSTLINLVCRFFDPNQGALRMDGVDLRHMRIADVRSRIAIVSQSTELFNETIEYNIAYGNPGATYEEIVQAAKEAHAHEFIETALPEKYQTKVGQNGHRLSGGQRQRIALARALLRKPEILILDEATSQIDMVSELLIRDSLEHHRGKRTMIIITHREALLELADVIYEVRDQKLQVATPETPALRIAA
jgi:ATP-binding cassette subfamily B protein/subfamily B ATP-binding cassette protein MsbA